MCFVKHLHQLMVLCPVRTVPGYPVPSFVPFGTVSINVLYRTFRAGTYHPTNCKQKLKVLV
jgi:hypothetical protein